MWTDLLTTSKESIRKTYWYVKSFFLSWNAQLKAVKLDSTAMGRALDEWLHTSLCTKQTDLYLCWGKWALSVFKSTLEMSLSSKVIWNFTSLKRTWWTAIKTKTKNNQYSPSTSFRLDRSSSTRLLRWTSDEVCAACFHYFEHLLKWREILTAKGEYGIALTKRQRNDVCLGL